MFKRIFSKLNPAEQSLKSKVISGGIWMYLHLLSKRGLTVVQTIVLARLLAPEHFGLVGVFFILSAALEAFTHTGFNKALVQREELDNGFLNTAWTVSIVRGFILAGAIFLLGSYAIDFLNAPDALPIIRVLGISLLLRGFHNPGIAHFLRNLEFNKQFVWQVIGVVANFVVSIPLAFILRNEWAIVWGLLASEVANIIFSFVLHPYRPKFDFDFKAFTLLFDYGKWLFLSAVLAFLFKQLDKVFITKLLGKAELGVYMIALRFAKIPELFSTQIPNVMFPVYSKFQSTPQTVRRMYLKTVRSINIFCIPLVGGMIILAKPFVSIFLGDKWLASVIPLQILVLATGLNITTSASMSLFNALDRTDFMFKLNFLKLLALIVIIYPLISSYKIIGAALCTFVLSIVGLFMWKAEITKLLKVTLKDIKILLFPVLNTLIFVIIIYYIDRLFAINNVLKFMAAGVIAIVVYFALEIIVHKFTRFKVLDDFVGIMSRKKQKPLNNE